MPEYVDFGIETDPNALALMAYERLQDLVPGWLPSAANFESLLIEANALMAAELRDLAGSIPMAIFKTFGENLLNLPPQEASSASGTTTWTVIDDAGYTIPAGTLVGLRAAGDELVVFEVLTDTVIPPGSTATAAGEVTIVAVDPGLAGSGLSGAVELVDTLDFVTGITVVGVTSGGEDAESEDQYLNRLREELQLLTPRPILPQDFAVLVKRIPGIDRATALDGYNPGDQTSNNERMVTVAVADTNGEAVSAPIKAQADTYLQGMREVNFIVHVVDPSYNTIDVTFSATCYPDFDPDEVAAAVVDALTAWLSPANWGIPPYGDPELWINEDTVRYLEVAEVINGVDGVRYITSLTIGLDGDPQVSADVPLSGPAPLTRAGDIAGSVVIP